MSDKGKSIKKWIIASIVVLCVLSTAVGGLIWYEANSNNAGTTSKNGGDNSNNSTADDATGESSAYEDADGMRIVQIAASEEFVAGLRKNGTVITGGRDGARAYDIEKWKDIKKIYASHHSIFGLKKDGTVVGGGWNKNDEKLDVSGLKNIVELYPLGSHICALNESGDLLLPYGNKIEVLETNVLRASVNGCIIGEKTDGSLFALGGESADLSKIVREWKDIVSYVAGSMYVAGIKSDGTVVAVDWEGNEKNIDKLTNIETLYVESAPIGITKDGKVVVNKASDKMEREISTWENVVKLDFGNPRPIVALSSDGTVSAYCKESEPFNVEGWTDVVDVAATEVLIIGLKKDGTIVYDGYEGYNLDHWNE